MGKSDTWEEVVFHLVVAIFVIIWIVLISNQTKREVIEHFDQKFDSLATVYRQVPATLYDNANKKCVLVYPDSVLYVRIKGEIKWI